MYSMHRFCSFFKAFFSIAESPASERAEECTTGSKVNHNDLQNADINKHVSNM